MNTLHEFLDYTVSKFGALDAYKWIDSESIRSKTYCEWRDDSERVAGRIRDAFGARKKIALVGDMSYPWICAYYGIMISANISVPLDTKLTAPEITERLEFADVSVVLLSERYASLRDEIIRQCGKVEAVLSLEDELIQASNRAIEPLPPVDPDALSSLMFTSGTSGDGLKAAMISQRMILADVTGPVPLCVPGDRLLSVLPIHHCFEIFVGQMKYQYLGGTICVNDSMANLLPNLTRFGITIVVAVPALANLLAGFIAQGLKTSSIDEVKQMLGGKLRRITIGGASASKEVIDTLGLAGITVFVGYGLTESTGGCLANCDASVRPREAGAPYVKGMEMKLADGELCLRGPMIMQGYYKAPELTARVMEGDWLHTGDIAEITEEGYVIILGRKDNMIKTCNGEKVYPEAWESKLQNIRGVGAAMVADVNNHLTAILFLKDDTPENREAVEKAVDAINARMPNYEKILDVRFREKPFPMTTSLKIKRGEVMKELAAQRKKAAALPQTEEQRRVWEKVSQVLPHASSIGIDDNLFNCGLDSLTALHLALFLGCDPTVIYSFKTIRQLAAQGTGSITPVWKKVSDINRYISEQPVASPDRKAGLGRMVLLTGASGFLGTHLMNELVKSGRQVICLVRNEATFEKACGYYGFSSQHDKVETVVGDITKPLLGLTEETYQRLCGRVESVFHAAALVSHVGSDDASYRVNVNGTEEVIRFCFKSGAQLFHISSYAVSGFNTNRTLTEDVLDIGQEINQNPYILTKYQAEEKVLQARGDGVSSTIFRIGNLTARESDGVFQMNADASGMAAQLRAFCKLGVFPESMRHISYDATAVDQAARAVALLAEQNSTGHIWHVMNPNVKTIQELTGARMVLDEEFIAKMTEQSADRDVAILSVYYRMNQAGFNPHFDSEKSQRELIRLGFEWANRG